MKSRATQTVTSNDEFVRLRVFDGDLLVDEAAVEKVRLDLTQKYNWLLQHWQAETADIVYDLLDADEPRAIARLKWIARRNRIDDLLRVLRLRGGRGVHRADVIMDWLGFKRPEWVGRSAWLERVKSKSMGGS